MTKVLCSKYPQWEAHKKQTNKQTGIKAVSQI